MVNGLTDSLELVMRKIEIPNPDCQVNSCDFVEPSLPIIHVLSIHVLCIHILCIHGAEIHLLMSRHKPMASQPSLASILPSISHSETSAILLDWVYNAESSSPSTWHSSLQHSRKAHQEHNISSPIQRRKRCRRALRPTSANVMSHRDHDTPVGKAQNDPRRSPRKRSPKKDWTYMPSTSLTPEPRYLILKTALLFNEIPTSHYHPLLNIYTWTSRADFRSCDSDAPILPSPTYNLNAADIRSQSKTLPSRESVSRSASPVKKFVDLYFTEVPTEYEDLDGHVAAKLGILTMYRRLQEIEEGVGIIPISLKVTNIMRSEEDEQV